MKSAWVEREAKQAVDRYRKAGVSAELALRVYSTRLLGRDPKLVLHGGGNSSLKTQERDLSGNKVAVLRVKGSGADMGAVEPPDFPAVRLDPLRALRARKSLSDAEMARVQRAFLIDPQAPSPSVEMLLHAFMPAKFVDHTHASAVLSLIDQPNAEELCRGRVPRPARFRALPDAGLRARQKSRRGVREKSKGRRPDPRQTRHLHLRRRRARGLRAHDRDASPARKTA